MDLDGLFPRGHFRAYARSTDSRCCAERARLTLADKALELSRPVRSTRAPGASSLGPVTFPVSRSIQWNQVRSVGWLLEGLL
jgi:hypothetical protein